MRRWLCLATGALVLAAPIFSSSVSKNRKGNKAYKEGKFDAAAQQYREAEVEDPEEKALSYNLANTLYRKKDFEAAAKSYERALSGRDRDLKKRALFNAGNNFYRQGAGAQDSSAQGKLEEAIKRYKGVLNLDPYDQAAKFNLQKALELMEQKKQQQQQQQQQDKNKDDKKDQKQNEQQGKDQKDKDKQKEQQQQQQAGQDKKDEKEQEKKGVKPGEIGPEEAKQLLEAVKQDEKDLQKKRLQMMMGDRKLEKDW
jgi:Ca-activated chloride channel family protein